MCVGLLRSSDLATLSTRQVNVTANKTFKVKYKLSRGDSVCAMLFNNTGYAINFSNVSIEHPVC